MAVKEESSHHATDELICSTPRKYYRAANGIDSNHWQLRSVVSSPKQNIVYYPSGQDIIRLNTKTRERETVTTVTFPLRCLAASKDWLAIGGETGEYIAVYVGDASTVSELAARTAADADARLPLSLEIPRNSSTRDESTSSRTSRSLRYHLFPEVQKIGADIVNSITLWNPPSYVSKPICRVPVAVIASNDCTVSIMNLEDLEVLQKLTFPDPVNRAIISPDGELLVAVGDDPYLYVHKRKSKPASKSRFESKRDVDCDWVIVDRIQIQGQRDSDKTQNRGSFAASFSQSGKYLAVATQYGIISIFLTSALTKEDHDPLIVAFTTSRPGDITGAVRALEFSPGPFDLLAWTENNGRCGVADVRDLFFSRQLLMIDSHAEGVERVYISERPGDSAIDPRLRSFRTDSASSTPDYLGLEFERRRLRDLTREMLDRYQPPLTADEMEVLQASGLARRERDAARDAREQDPTSARRAWDDGPRSSSRSATPEAGATERRISTTGLPTLLRDFVQSDRSPNFSAFIDRQNQDRERRDQQSELLGRISGRLDRLGMLVDAGTTSIYVRERESVGSSSSVTRNGNDTTGLERLSLAPPRLPAIGTDSTNNAWAELEARYRNRYEADTAARSTRLSTRIRIEREDDDRRNFAQSLRQPWRPLDDSTDASSLRRANRGEAIETQGLSWSPDGKILYVGAKDGIHEFSVNVAGRKMFPSLVLR